LFRFDHDPDEFMLHRLNSMLLCAGLFGLLASCGGGESGSASTGSTSANASLPQTSIEGVWQGLSPSGAVVMAAILDGGALWMAYGLPVATSTSTGTDTTATGSGTTTGTGSTTGTATTSWKGFGALDGFIQGVITLGSTGSVTGSELRDFASFGNLSELKLAGKLVSSANISGTFTSPSAAVTVSLAPAPSTSYVYGTAARLSKVTGTWSGTDLSGASASAVIDSAAGIRITQGSCIYTGTVIPKNPSIASENIFDAKLTAGASCGKRASLTFTGIALHQTVASGKTEIVLLALTEDKAQPFAFLASR